MQNRKSVQIKILNENLVDDDTPYRMGLEKKHSLDFSVYTNPAGYTYLSLDFTTRLAMFEFAKRLMRDALFESWHGHFELNSYDFGDGSECVDGVRFSDATKNIHVSYGTEDDITDEDLGIALSQQQ